MRYQWISRVLMKPLIDPDRVMAPFAREVLSRLVAEGQPLVLILDQSQLNDRQQVLMLAVRYGDRALPVLWRVAATEGAIGFPVQQALALRRGPGVARGGRGLSDGGSLLWHGRPDLSVPGAAVGLSHPAERQSGGSRRRGANHNRATGQGPALENVQLTEGDHQHRCHPRPRSRGTLDYRPVRHAGLSENARLPVFRLFTRPDGASLGDRSPSGKPDGDGSIWAPTRS